jgi:tetratricopeptide (TPR) repeat protein
MTRAFIIRPFGAKAGVNFDAVDEMLIQPALAQIGVIGNTTTEIVEQGNIREDMFRLLVCADLVIADISIHNANVFYELGIRHGMRPNATFLLRANVDEYPFDLRTDRYLSYDQNDPASSVTALARALRATLDSSHVDSPVYQVLPTLKAPDATALHVVPSDFREAVERASAANQRGDLRLLAHEASSFEWASEGLRLVGRAQFSLKSNPGARESFEMLRELRPDDVEADQRLATIYQRLGDFARSSQAIQRVIASSLADRGQRADALALHGRIVRTRWLERFGGRSGEEARKAALCAPELDEALKWYMDAFHQDLNRPYPGLAALGLLCIRNELARAMPDAWTEQFDSDDDAARELGASVAQFGQLASTIQFSLKSRREALQRQLVPDSEELARMELHDADFALITSPRPKAVAQRYLDALTDQPEAALGTVHEHLDVFRQLEVRNDFAVAALAALAELIAGKAALAQPAAAPTRVLLFTGHMVDGPGRPTPRFPPTKAAEEKAREMLSQAIAAEQALSNGKIVGLGGGACGGDILFHEACAELGIPTQLHLALPRERYCVTSVQRGGPDWVERYYRLCARLAPRIMMESEELPKWLRGKPGYDVWQRANLWMLFNALALRGKELTLVALWDTGDGSGPGGTDEMVSQVRASGHKLLRLPAEELKSLV